MKNYVNKLDRRMIYEISQELHLGNFRDSYIIKNATVLNRGTEDLLTITVESRRGFASYSYMFDNYGIVNAGAENTPLVKINDEFSLNKVVGASKDVTKNYIKIMSQIFGESYLKEQHELRTLELSEAQEAVNECKQVLENNTAQIEVLEERIRREAAINHTSTPQELTDTYAVLLKLQSENKNNLAALEEKLKYATEIYNYTELLTASARHKKSNGKGSDTHEKE